METDFRSCIDPADIVECPNCQMEAGRSCGGYGPTCIKRYELVEELLTTALYERLQSHVGDDQAMELAQELAEYLV